LLEDVIAERLGIPEGPIGLIEKAHPLERETSSLGLRRRESVRMKGARNLIETLLQLGTVLREPSCNTQSVKVILTGSNGLGIPALRADVPGEESLFLPWTCLAMNASLVTRRSLSRSHRFASRSGY
jgi:hypothetical protein